jgi:integrase
MPRKRNRENRGLPLRWQFYHGAYYYLVPPGQESLWDGRKRFRLGRTLVEAHREWAHTIGQLLDQYALQHIPSLRPKTQASYLAAIQRLKPVFGAMPLLSLRASHVYKYLHKRGARKAGTIEMGVLSHAYTKAIEWGLVDQHPIKRNVVKLGTPSRDRYVEDWELLEALSLRSRRKKGSVKVVQAFLRIKLLTGRRRAEILRVRSTDLLDEGVQFTLAKKRSRKTLIVEWSDELRQAVQDALDARPVDIAPWLFCNRRGQPYMREDGTANGWDSMWQRFMLRVLQETTVSERFTEHDIRAKAGSDAESLERARQLLAHADTKMTQRAYRRKPEVVKPLR